MRIIHGWRGNLGRYLQMDRVWVFALLARLWRKDRKTDALRVLTTYQAIEQIPGTASFLAGLVAAFWPGRAQWVIPLAFVSGGILALSLVRVGALPVIRATGLLLLTRAGLRVPGLLLHLGVMVVLFVAFEWTTPLWWLAGYIALMVAEAGIEFFLTALRLRRTGLRITASGANFLHAYRLHAKKIGVTSDVFLSEEEWEADDGPTECYGEFASKCPEGAANFLDRGPDPLKAVFLEAAKGVGQAQR